MRPAALGDAGQLPHTTMLGALCQYISHAAPDDFQPMKANMGILPPLENPPRNKRQRMGEYAARAQRDLEKALEELVLK